MTVYDENAVPVLYRGPDQQLGISAEGLAALDKARDAAIKAFDAAAGDPEKEAAARDKHYLLGESVLIDNQDPARPDFSAFVVGASTLDEAVKECIAGFDLAHIGDPDVSSDAQHRPAWVASTSKDIAERLADYYSCAVRDIAEVL